MKLLNKINNGILLIIIGIMHTQFGLSADAFQNQFIEFSASNFFKISNGLGELPAQIGVTNFAHFAAFWFFYFGIFVVSIGFLVYGIERKKQLLPSSFTISYLIFILIGVYMVPNSGITFIMLPQAVYMLGINIYRKRKQNGIIQSHKHQ